MEKLTPKQYGKKYAKGISKAAVCKQIREGRLPKGVTAEKVGGNYIVSVKIKRARKK